MALYHSDPHQQLTRYLATEADTLALGASLAPGLEPGMRVYLGGDLGAGKTTLVNGMLQALGVMERVRSPTFTLLELYRVSSLYLYHFDFYRFSSVDEWADAGFREYFNNQSVCLVEWPERAGGQLPVPDLRIELRVDGGGRSVTVTAHTEAGRRCLERLEH